MCVGGSGRSLWKGLEPGGGKGGGREGGGGSVGE